MKMPKYQSALQHYVAARIFVFPEDDFSAPRTQLRIVRTGGETIEGFVEVTIFGDLDIQASIAFTGVSRIWIESNAASDTPEAPLTTAEHKFLIEKYHGPGCQTQVKGPFIIQRYPFHFAVPEELISPFGDVNPLYLKIPPTAKLGPTYRRSSDGKTFMQPLIVYHLKTILTASSNEPYSAGSTFSVQREVEVFPLSSMEPPLPVVDYPGEFRLQAQANAYNGFLQRPRGMIQVSTDEPRSLNVSTSAPRACTKLFVGLTFDVNASIVLMSQPSEWDCEVQTTLRSKTFCSVAKMERNASMADASRKRSLSVRVEEVGNEVRQLTALDWRRNHLLSDGTVKADKAALAWTTVLCIPVSAPKALLPTFATEMAARRYSIVVQIRFTGVRHSRLMLEVPVQVTSNSMGGTCGVALQIDEEVDHLGTEMDQLNVDDSEEEGIANLPPPYSEME